MNAIMVDNRDNVVVVIEAVHEGMNVDYTVKDGTVFTLTTLEDIPIYHKVAVSDLLTGSPVIKYGERIGIASIDIKAGMHVHEHNVQSVSEQSIRDDCL